jgi:hypothetical protein
MSRPRFPSADARRLAAELERAGCEVWLAGNGHLRVHHPRRGFLSVASTPSCWHRERLKVMTWLRRRRPAVGGGDIDRHAESMGEILPGG